MSELHEVFEAVGFFTLFMIVIPVVVYTIGIIVSYKRKEAKKRDNR